MRTKVTLGDVKEVSIEDYEKSIAKMKEGDETCDAIRDKSIIDNLRVVIGELTQTKTIEEVRSVIMEKMLFGNTNVDMWILKLLME